MAPERAKPVSLARAASTPKACARPLVLAEGEQGPAGAAVADAAQADERRASSTARRQVVDAGGRVDVDAPEQRRPLDAGRSGTQSAKSKRGFSKYDVVASEKAKVVTAR